MYLHPNWTPTSSESTESPKFIVYEMSKDLSRGTAISLRPNELWLHRRKFEKQNPNKCPFTPLKLSHSERSQFGWDEYLAIIASRLPEQKSSSETIPETNSPKSLLSIEDEENNAFSSTSSGSVCGESALSSWDEEENDSSTTSIKQHSNSSNDFAIESHEEGLNRSRHIINKLEKNWPECNGFDLDSSLKKRRLPKSICSSILTTKLRQGWTIIADVLFEFV